MSILTIKAILKADKKSLTAQKAAIKSACDGICKDKYLPPGSSGHVSQYIKAVSKQVTLYDESKERSREVTEFIKKAPEGSKDTFTETRCATEVRTRTDILLALQAKPPTMRPRPGQEFSMHNAIFHASCTDDGNCSGWNDNDPVIPTFVKQTDYLHIGITAKRTAVEKMKSLGFDESQKDCSAPSYIIRRGHQHISKYFCFATRYPESFSVYLGKVTAIDAEVAAAVKRLCYSTYINYKMKGGNEYSKERHEKRVKVYAMCAFGFEPMADWYTKAHFELFGIPEAYTSFLVYSEVVKKVKRSEAADLEEMQSISLGPASEQRHPTDMMPERRPKPKKKVYSGIDSQLDTPTKVLVTSLKNLSIMPINMSTQGSPGQEATAGKIKGNYNKKGAAGKSKKAGIVTDDQVLGKRQSNQADGTPQNTSDEP